MRLEQIPRVTFCHSPTPIEPLDRLSAHLNGPRIFIKRDDCTGLAGGGNKTRKLEFLIADALHQGATTVITTGGVQSNHARQTAAACARFGLKCHLVLPRVVDRHDDNYEHNGNVLLDQLLGATVHVVETREHAAAKIADLTEDVSRAGGKTYFIPTGGSNRVGALGYVDAARECVTQCRGIGIEPTHHVVVTGSVGTHAGILVGLATIGAQPHVIGISISEPADAASEKVSALAHQTAQYIGLDSKVWDDQVDVRDEWIGEGYGEPTDGMREAVSLVARLEGILLDPVYTGKAMAGLIALIRSGEFEKTDRILFWHTGGMPALFAYDREFVRGSVSV